MLSKQGRPHQPVAPSWTVPMCLTHGSMLVSDVSGPDPAGSWPKYQMLPLLTLYRPNVHRGQSRVIKTGEPVLLLLGQHMVRKTLSGNNILPISPRLIMVSLGD